MAQLMDWDNGIKVFLLPSFSFFLLPSLLFHSAHPFLFPLSKSYTILFLRLHSLQFHPSLINSLFCFVKNWSSIFGMDTLTLRHVHLSIQWYEGTADLTSRFPLEERAATAWGLTLWSTWCRDQEDVNPRVLKVWYSIRQRDCYFTFLKERTFTTSSTSTLSVLGCQQTLSSFYIHLVSSSLSLSKTVPLIGQINFVVRL